MYCCAIPAYFPNLDISISSNKYVKARFIQTSTGKASVLCIPYRRVHSATFGPTPNIFMSSARASLSGMELISERFISESATFLAASSMYLSLNPHFKTDKSSTLSLAISSAFGNE